MAHGVNGKAVHKTYVDVMQAHPWAHLDILKNAEAACVVARVARARGRAPHTDDTDTPRPTQPEMKLHRIYMMRVASLARRGVCEEF